jgi:phosphoribosylamine--glycine ligase
LRVLVVGAGGREHALVSVIAASPLCLEVHAAPGNPGIALVGKCHPVKVDDIDGQVALARELKADLVVVGPEVPLVLGLADRLRKEGIAVFGPSAAAAQVEGSKAFTKELLEAAGVDTAEAYAVATLDEAREAIAKLGGRCVVKADGLAAGKGVVVCDEAAEAEQAADELLGGSLGTAGATLVIAERMEGPELSVLALCDGEAAVPLPSARDYKRIGEGGTGPNTGGMGAISPAPGVSDEDAQRIVDTVHKPILLRLPVRGPDAHRDRPARPGVQRALRRPRDRGRAAAARRGPAAVPHGLRQRHAAGRHAAHDPGRGRDGDPRLARLSGVVRVGHPDHGCG